MVAAWPLCFFSFGVMFAGMAYGSPQLRVTLHTDENSLIRGQTADVLIEVLNEGSVALAIPPLRPVSTAFEIDVRDESKDIIPLGRVWSTPEASEFWTLPSGCAVYVHLRVGKDVGIRWPEGRPCKRLELQVRLAPKEKWYEGKEIGLAKAVEAKDFSSNTLTFEVGNGLDEDQARQWKAHESARALWLSEMRERAEADSAAEGIDGKSKKHKIRPEEIEEFLRSQPKSGADDDDVWLQFAMLPSWSDSQRRQLLENLAARYPGKTAAIQARGILDWPEGVNGVIDVL